MPRTFKNRPIWSHCVHTIPLGGARDSAVFKKWFSQHTASCSKAVTLCDTYFLLHRAEQILTMINSFLTVVVWIKISIHPRPLFCLSSLLSNSNTILLPINVKMIHRVSGAGIQTHDLQDILNYSNSIAMLYSKVIPWLY